MTDLTQKLRSLDDGVSRPVSILEREMCGQAADAIDALVAALQHCLIEHGGFTIKGETERKARAAIALVSEVKETP